MNKKQEVPQHLINLAAERIVLGKVLSAESNYWAVNDSLRDFHFFRNIHSKIYAAIRDILTDGKKLSLTMIESHIGEEYDDGQSTSIYMTALLRDSEDITDWATEVEDIIDKWRSRKLLQVLDDARKAAIKPEAMSTDLLSDLEVRLQDISVNSQAEPLKSLGSIAERAITKSAKAHDSGDIPGFDTGLPTLDQILGRIHPGDLGFIGGRPGDGKSVVGVQLALRAQRYAPCLYFQLEMQDEDMARRVLAGETGISVSDIESGQYDFDQMEQLKAANDRLADSRVFIDDRPKLAFEQIRDRCVAMKRSKGLGMVVVDHVRLVRVLAKTKDKWERVEYVTGELKSLAKSLKVAFVVLSQVTRASQRRDDPSPQLNDFDSGSSLEQDADWAIGLFRRDRWLKSQRPHEMDSRDGREWAEKMSDARGKIEMTILKRRRGDDGEMRQFEFDGRRSMIKELER
jgi:replicative DNA helicase